MCVCVCLCVSVCFQVSYCYQHQTKNGGKKKDVPFIQDSQIRTDFKSNFLENKKLQSNRPHSSKYPQTHTGKTENKG